ncbi:MAG: YebC/PmpR family DNA-binding transcriptional regulator [Firmicutes bacterium]|nr:YebC/PmpR family DNA-binding transcriptional regulator [Bacillota bacterium]NLL88717.1 YebC/PmpR family DNA-binding transcriptional regulator [Bacillota bacterium]
MAGHSKWANIKHKKAAQDAKRGQVFTKIARQITVAVKEGGPDPETNFKLRLAVEKARSVNMPNDNIERAVNRGIGGLDGNNYEEIVYEGYGPNGVAILMDVLTDNRNRTASEVRHRLSKFGGNLGESGCVAWMFDKKGLVVIEKQDQIDEDELMMAALEAGAEDVQTDVDVYKVLTAPGDFTQVRAALTDAGYEFLVAEVSMIPQNSIMVSSEESEKIERLIEALEELDDVQQVYTNYEIED